MAERKAANKYYPPEWTPDQGSINTFRGSHPLRERARKLDQGIMIIRFELPYNIWCGGCGEHVGMGVRYNAEKSKVGNYYSTPIYKFRMKCHLCDNHFEIQTDPKNMEYEVVSGASRKNERWQEKEGETASVEGKTEAARLATDPMYRLEHDTKDKRKAEEEAPRIARIMEMNQDWLDDYTLNQKARKTFRTQKVELKAKAEEDAKLKEKASISLTLLDEKSEDISAAKNTSFVAGSSREDRKRKRIEIKTESVFGAASGSSDGKKTARAALIKACTRMDGGVFGGKSPASGSSSSAARKRSQLGVKTRT